VPRVRLALTLVTVAALTAPAPGRAQSWLLCTPGAFHSCHSVSASTVPVMSGSTRVGTIVTLTVANLQGTYALDNAAWSGLTAIGVGGGSTLDVFGAFSTFALNGGATGSGTFQAFGSSGSETAYNIFNATGTGLIGGCAAVPITASTPLGASFHTCGAGASVSFSVTLSVIFDASDFTYAKIDVLGPNGEVQCVSDPARATSRPPVSACDVEPNDVAVTPEPVTIALLGTGLFGIGAARVRRRKKDAAAGG